MRIKRLSENAIVPTKGSQHAAGYDLYSTETVSIRPHETALIGTGWAMEFPIGYFGAIYARSGLATKEGLRPANCVGVIDSDYRGEVKVALHNDTNTLKTVTAGDRIAQLIIMDYFFVSDFEEVNVLSDTNRDTSGFGSTGR